MNEQVKEQKKIDLKDLDTALLVGPQDKTIRQVEERTGCKVVVRHHELTLIGEAHQLANADQIVEELIFLIRRNGYLKPSDVDAVIDLACMDAPKEMEPSKSQSPVIRTTRGEIRPKTTGQANYVHAVHRNDVVFAIGPAGTGKTYLAVALALSALQNKSVSKIVLTRPAIEAGENLGFLPGDLMEKVDPYLRPLTDALFEMMPSEQLQKHMERKIIEIVPLGYMRGRTLNHSFVILDEAQNTSTMQMKMFLTRLGMHSKAIITGDVTQIDLPSGTDSGLVQIQDILKDIKDIEFVFFNKEDVVRHRLVREIIHAYECYHNNQINGDETL